ncbi:iron chelate uptake ABC transporter family permease subunit [Kitasatospora sp. NPDC096204]|uniref:iron chelate uptake ABC transporter family permease subunit n=1 Tax=Kitasatospora sp. NPDC096204 TaxID=3364094 RepID=UPI0037F8A940
MRRIAATHPGPGPLRVLEVGAATGVTTEAVTRVLAAEGRPGTAVDYLCTEASDLLLDAARARTGTRPRVRFARFDVHHDPHHQGFRPHSFDVVIGADVLAAAHDPEGAAHGLAELLTPGGWLLLTEPMAAVEEWHAAGGPIWSYPFMVNAFAAGTMTAVLAGALGWFMVLRRQSFTGHTLALVGFPGAAGAVLLGLSALTGYFAFCLVAALVIAAVPRAGRFSGAQESALTGTVQSFLLACGYLFVVLYRGSLGGVNALLFGSFLGITVGQVAVLAAVAAVVLLVLAAIGRPLLFASVDPEVAAGRGVRVRALSVLFLLLLAAATAATSQITGTLLVFALLVMPAATAQALTGRPGLGLALTVLIAVAVTWLALVVAFSSPYPIGFFLTSFAFGGYVLVRLGRTVAGALRRVSAAARAVPTGGAR